MANDPAREYWLALIKRVHRRVFGFRRLPTTERHYWCANVLYGEVFNGGFDQFFFNSSGSYYPETVAALKELDAAKSLKLLEAAKQIIFRDRDVIRGIQKRREYLVDLTENDKSIEALLAPLDSAFWNEPDDLSGRLEKYAARKRLYRA